MPEPCPNRYCPTTAEPHMPITPRRPWELLLGEHRILVLADSLAFHGPQRGELLTEPRLWPNVLAHELPAAVDVVARRGWTARDPWWALTRDPNLYSVPLPRADPGILAIGGRRGPPPPGPPPPRR